VAIEVCGKKFIQVEMIRSEDEQNGEDISGHVICKNSVLRSI
jgi:hypothetical protein